MMMIVSKRIEKIEKYANLSIELKELWGMKTMETIPVVIGCAGTVEQGLDFIITPHYPKTIQIE